MSGPGRRSGVSKDGQAAQAGGAADRAREATALVDAARTGDPLAFDQLVRRYRARVFALALHLTGCRSDADDITQDVFLQAFARICTFEGRSDFFTWLYRVTLHRALNVRRSDQRRPGVSLHDERVRLALAIDAGDDPRRVLELRESYGQLMVALDALPVTLRTTVILVSLQGFSYSEAAIVLRTTEGTIAWRVHEAREQLRASLAKLGKRVQSSAGGAGATWKDYLERLSLQPIFEELG